VPVNPYTPSFVLAALLTITPAFASEMQASATQPPTGTGHLYAGAYLGLLANNGVAPNFGLQVAGPIPLQGLPPKLHLEWTGALDFWFRSDSESAAGFEVDASVFNIGVIPGGRIVVPVVPEVLLYGDLGVGLALQHASLSTSFGGEQSDTDFGLVFRVGAGAIIPLNERVRLDVTPLALQAYTSGGTAFSMQVGISFALD
jgi:opacity protein-like surface antigen